MSEMLENILSNENVERAYKRVYANKGAGGVDGVTTRELEEYMRVNWRSIKEQIRARAYKPQPVLRVEIPKPNGGVRKLKALCKRSWSVELTYRIKKINEVTRGWINYFRKGSMKNNLHSIDEHLRTQIRVVIWKQWKVPTKRLWGLLKLGVPKWIAKKVANWGDHYQFVASKSVLARAISKEKLTKRGLVSLYDYYLMVAHI